MNKHTRMYYSVMVCNGASQMTWWLKNLPAYAGDTGYTGLIPRWGKIPWRREWQPTPVFLPRESYGQRSLAGYSPWGCKESATTEQLIYTLYKTSCSFGLAGVRGRGVLEGSREEVVQTQRRPVAGWRRGRLCLQVQTPNP